MQERSEGLGKEKVMSREMNRGFGKPSASSWTMVQNHPENENADQKRKWQNGNLLPVREMYRFSVKFVLIHPTLIHFRVWEIRAIKGPSLSPLHLQTQRVFHQRHSILVWPWFPNIFLASFIFVISYIQLCQGKAGNRKRRGNLGSHQKDRLASSLELSTLA